MKTSIKYWFTAGTLASGLFGPGAIADVTPTPSPSAIPSQMAVDPVKVSALMEILRPLLLPQVRQLSQPVSLYSWTNRSSVGLPLAGNISTTDPAFVKYARSSSNAYFRYTLGSDDAMGNGFYLAVDPFVSRRFGARGSTWTLLELEGKVSARYLDLSDRFGEPSGFFRFDTPGAQAINAAGCAVDYVTEVFSVANAADERRSISPGLNGNGQICRAIRNAIAKDPILNISAVKYYYGKAPYVECGGDTLPGNFAFNVWDADRMFDLEHTKGFAEGYEPNDPDLDSRAMIAALFTAPIVDPAQNFTEFGRLVPYPELASRVVPDVLAEYMHRRLMSCGNLDGPVPIPIP